MFLPDPQRRGEIDFVFAKALAYDRRLWIIVALASAGFAVQVLLSPWLPLGALVAGAALLLAASLLAVVKGFSNIPDRLPGRREWRGADRKQLENIVAMGAKSRAWDQSLVDVTCVSGAVTLLGVLAAIVGGALLLATFVSHWLAAAWVLDAGVLLLPHWITGVRRVLTNDPLVIQVRGLLDIMDYHAVIGAPGEELLPQMQVRSGADGEIPCDVKLICRIPDLGDDFLGVQTQVVLNHVQGKSYPYLYCVLVARRPMGMLGKLHAPAPPKMVIEPNTEDDVDIIVIRNLTTKTSGYHTNPARSRAIFAAALGEARRLQKT